MGHVDDAAIRQHLSYDQIPDAIAFKEIAIHGDLVRLDVDNFGIGDVLIIVLDIQGDVYVAILAENADGNSADRAPDGALMMSRAQRIHDLGDITPRVDDLTRYLHAFWCRGFSRRI